MSLLTQQEAMSILAHGHPRDKAERIYAQLEERGVVSRKRNVNDLTPREYAKRLYSDGRSKGTW